MPRGAPRGSRTRWFCSSSVALSPTHTVPSLPATTDETGGYTGGTGASSRNRQAIGSLYETFPPETAKDLWDRFEFIHTPKHGSWLNIAESEMNVLIRQCLDRRIDTIEEMRSETEAWNRRRDNAPSHIDWQFTSVDVRVKLKRLCPTLNA